MGYAVQNFSNQILVKNTSPTSYKKVILIMTIFGIFAYGFFSFSSFGTLFASIKGILNRESLIPSPETIEDYFSSKSWQVKLIQISYLLNLLSTAPEFCILMK
jgi:amino acid permease